MNYDEQVYCLVSPNDRRIAAVGVRLLDRADYLVGVYLFWSSIRNPRQFLRGIVQDFGEARLYAEKNSTYNPGLVCKMSISVPSLALLAEDTEEFRRLHLDLLEMRASNPKPFIALYYDVYKQAWDCHPLLALRCVDSNYSYVPN